MSKNVTFEDWVAEFSKDKTEVGGLEQSTLFAVHTIRRFLEKETLLWEIAFTYTGRLVVRSGLIDADGVTIKWTDWITHHDVDVHGKSRGTSAENNQS